MLNGDGLVGYNIDLLNGREHLSIENLNHEIIGAESNLSLVQTAAFALQSLENQLSRISNFVREISDLCNLEKRFLKIKNQILEN